LSAHRYGKSLLDVFASEFTTYPREYYIHAIENGRITVIAPCQQLPRVAVPCGV
jgi:hypothetical protein